MADFRRGAFSGLSSQTIKAEGKRAGCVPSPTDGYRLLVTIAEELSPVDGQTIGPS
jgi:hypothetical protein